MIDGLDDIDDESLMLAIRGLAALKRKRPDDWLEIGEVVGKLMPWVTRSFEDPHAALAVFEYGAEVVRESIEAGEHKVHKNHS